MAEKPEAQDVDEVTAAEAAVEDDLEIEVVDDTPEEDRDKSPMPREVVQELESDELEEYTGKVKSRLKQMKKVWHDERREKEQARREQEAAINYAKQIQAENKRLKATLSSGERQLVDTYKSAAEGQLSSAQAALRAAMDADDNEAAVKAQTDIASASYRLEQAKAYRPTLQEAEEDVTSEQEVPVQARVTDPKTIAWQERNEWWGSDRVMTGAAFGLHQDLLDKHGQGFVGTDEYWETIDNTMHRRFPEYFSEEDGSTNGSGKPATPRKKSKPANVVTPASRTTSVKKVRLTKSQAAVARKFGLTNEQYAREQLKLDQMES